METCQIKNLKSILQCCRSTPNFILRLETGTKHIFYEIITRALNWWIKILKLNDTCITKTVYNRLKHLDSSKKSKYNMVTTIKKTPSDLGITSLWTGQSNNRNDISSILMKH